MRAPPPATYLLNHGIAILLDFSQCSVNRMVYHVVILIYQKNDDEKHLLMYL